MITGPVAAAEHSGRDAKRAVYAVFIANGFALATWASRIPQVRDGLGVTPAGLGLILLSAAVGSLLAMPLSGIVVTRLGEARTVVVMALTLAVGLAATATHCGGGRAVAGEPRHPERLIRAGRLKRYRRFGDRKTYVDLDEAKQVLDWREE